MTLSSLVLEPLSRAEQRQLLSTARASIRAALTGRAAPMSDPVSPALVVPGAAFVSVYVDGGLRGCVGTIAAEEPLQQAIARLACSAALEDPRFEPLQAAELDGLQIEISHLSTLTAVTAADILPGVHGVCIEHFGQRAVFLPKVATEHGWDRDSLLAALCHKAMLPADAWRQPGTELWVFTAEVFADDDADLER